MQITVNGEVVLDRSYSTYDALLADYQEDAESRNEEVPLYDPAALTLSLSLFVLGQAIALYYRRSASKSQEARHLELLKRLDEFRATSHDAVAAERLGSIIREGGLVVDYKAQSDVDDELKGPIQKIISPPQVV